jgi:prepilin-type N-terminal cleavage/methylation domain-containing protein
MMGMMKFRSQRTAGRRGFTLIELAIVLGVASLLFAGLWRLMSSGNTQLRDQAAADQQKQLIAAMQGYLASADGQGILTPLALNATTVISLPTNFSTCAGANTVSMCSYLPSGFTTGSLNSYGQSFNIEVRKDGGGANQTATAYSFMILTQGGTTIPDTSGGRISSMIGNDGGFVYGVQACGAQQQDQACGSYGAWNSLVTAYGFASSANNTGHVASRTFVGLNAAQSSPWLARSVIPTGPTFSNHLPDFNTMQTNLFLYTATNITSLPTTGNDIYLGGNTIWGGAEQGTIAGSIENIKTAILGSTASNFSLPSSDILIAQVPCTQYTGGDTTGYGTPLIAGSASWPGSCVNALRVYGDAAFNGQLVANYLKAGYFVYNSDERLKHDIEELKGNVANLEKIRGVSFVFNKDKTNARRLGVIAQDVEKVYPELVHQDKDGFKEVDYLGLIGPLVGAVKDLETENEALQAQMKEQEALIQDLSKRVGEKK